MCGELRYNNTIITKKRMGQLNVLFVTLADLPEGGGSTNRLKMLLTAVASCGHHVSLLNEHALGFAPRRLLRPAGRIGDVEYKYVLGSIERSFGLMSIGTKIQAVERLAREIRIRHGENAIDIVWFNQLSFYNTYPITKLAQHLGICTIQSYEDERPELVIPTRTRLLSAKLYGVDLRLADQYCPRMADAVIVISRYLKLKYLKRVSNPLRVHLVPTIVDCDYWDVGPEPPTDTPTLLYAGTFSEQDEIDNLMKALAVLRSRGRRFRVTVLGSHRDPERVENILSLIRTLGLGDLIDMRGFVPLDEVRRQIASSNILLNIRRDGIWSRSGLSTKLSEYLASGRTVVCTDLGDVPLYLKHSQSALLVPATATSEQIAAAIDVALTSPELREKIGRAGREVATKYFGLRAVRNKLGAIIESAASIHNISQ